MYLATGMETPIKAPSRSSPWTRDDFDFGSPPQPIGQGRFGHVFAAKEKRSNKVVGIKVLFKKELEACGVVKQLRQEIEVHCKLRHPNIIRMFGWFQDPHRVYVVMSLAEGGDLLKYLRAQPQRRLAEPQAAFYMRQLLDALTYLHGQGIIHRDLKPENLLLNRRGHLLLCDFGWCTSSKRLRQTVCGTQGDYLAPEVLAREPYGPSVDLWTAGVMAFELLHGRTPFERRRSDEKICGGQSTARDATDRLAHSAGEEDEESSDEELLSERGQRIHFREDLTDEACNFIMRVLQSEPSLRPSLEEALADPWLDESNVAPPVAFSSFLVSRKRPGCGVTVKSNTEFSKLPSCIQSHPPSLPDDPLYPAPPLSSTDSTPLVIQPILCSDKSGKGWSRHDFAFNPNPIGRGRYGSVYMAREKKTGRRVAVKVLHKAQLEADGVWHQIKNEVEIHCKLRHRHIVRCHGYFHDELRLYLVMEYCPVELYRKLKSCPGGRFRENEAAKYIMQLIEALQFLHGQGIIHRDLKPENLLLGPTGDLLLADFGWCVGAVRGSHGIRLRQTLCGTPDYVSPEMLRHDGKGYAESVDTWSVGVLCYEFLVGRTPFRRSSPVTFQEEDDVEGEALKNFEGRMFENIMDGKVSFPLYMSKAAQDFIEKLLIVDTRVRMTLQEAMRHPWMRMHTPSIPLSPHLSQQRYAADASTPSYGRELLGVYRKGVSTSTSRNMMEVRSPLAVKSGHNAIFQPLLGLK
ncbi:hypothetical protein NSK_004242 [Nannochloropsis salina CCMP1776]|jgi:aurora kinase A|uniref:Aurora kinase n=1 Tax=Nannochloropsis salina CCMP1776 TaxID=1027361 RepID=A0A4D9CXW8_9STRA|nr:hypothetical protein NSK_004242 [Nannochloropsis salina CCMP1776]|eukprot:TFJ84251.1 hypothetical protein NSK_004242 [Nannochloropsis salina CCMP1776]